MFAYTYNHDTKEYLGKTETELDPLETEQQGQQVWLLPADSTFTAPPDPKDGFAIVWNGEAWEYKEDHRGKEYWLPGDTWESPAREMKELGPLPDGALLEKPEKPFDVVRSEALASVDSATSAAILAGFEYEVDPGKGTPEKLHFSYDSFDQQNFADTANVATLALSGQQGLQTEVIWNAYRNHTEESKGELVRVQFDPQTFLELYTLGALNHKGTQMELGGQRKQQIEAATSVDEIQELLKQWNI